MAMAATPRYRHMPLGDLDSVLLPPLLQNRVAIAHASSALAKFTTDAGQNYKDITWFEAAAKNDAVTLDATDAVGAKGGANGGTWLGHGGENDKVRYTFDQSLTQTDTGTGKGVAPVANDNALLLAARAG